MPARLSHALTAVLLILALIGNLSVSFGIPSPAEREMAAAQTELRSLFGPTIAFCTPAMVDDGSGAPSHHGTADCILCCLPSPLRLAVLVQVPVLLAVPKPAMVQAPWPPLAAEWYEADPPPAPYRPRDPPTFG